MGQDSMFDEPINGRSAVINENTKLQSKLSNAPVINLINSLSY